MDFWQEMENEDINPDDIVFIVYGVTEDSDPEPVYVTNFPYRVRQYCEKTNGSALAESSRLEIHVMETDNPTECLLGVYDWVAKPQFVRK